MEVIFIVGYKQPWRYCNALLPPNSKVCPVCEKINPVDQVRCPNCRNPIKKAWKACSNCGLVLELTCPECGETTFAGDYCDHCEARLTVRCTNDNCGVEQPPISDHCISCGKALK